MPTTSYTKLTPPGGDFGSPSRTLPGAEEGKNILNRKCAYFTGVNAERIVALNGAAQIYPLLRRLYGARNFAVPTPTFGEYARSFPEASLYPDGALPSGEGVDGLVVVNPNNCCCPRAPLTRQLSSGR